MRRALILILGVLSALGACTQRTICPAFQSAYIYDRDELRKKFSYFQEDSTPKILTASKNRYLVAEPTPYRKKLQKLQTVAMKPVLVVVPDSLLSADSVSAEALDLAARSVLDTLFMPDLPAVPLAEEDSVYVITRDRELRLLKYDAPDSLIYDATTGRYVPEKPAYRVKHVRLNVDQDNYMWYLRNYLVLPDVKLARQQQDASRDSGQKSAKGKKAKKGLKGFFKDLFKKKPKESDSTDIPPPPRDEFDFIDVDTIAQAAPPSAQPAARKGLFAARKRKANEDVNTEEARPGRRLARTSAEAVREEEEDKPATEQGF